MKKLILVLGMHRSGTSAMAQSLQNSGAFLGEKEELFLGDKYNPDGYFEYGKVIAIHDKLLHYYERQWSSCDWFEVDPGDEMVLSLRKDLSDIIQYLFSKNQIVCIKDPRTALFLPLWGDLLFEMNIIPEYVWIYRNPKEVADSLTNRNGFLTEQGITLWEYYNIRIMEFLANREYVKICYDELFDAAKVFPKIKSIVGTAYKGGRNYELENIIKPEFRHAKYSGVEWDMEDKLCKLLWSKLNEEQISEQDSVVLKRMYMEKIKRYPLPKHCDAEAVHNKDFFNNKQIVIYGAGNRGKKAAYQLRVMGKNNCIFCDKNKTKQGTMIDGIKVVSLESLRKILGMLVVIVAIEYPFDRKEAEESFRYFKQVQFVSYLTLESITGEEQLSKERT